mmetsp:Transcript_17964/g.29140  ORF Transcript_17964/g.29140 Transcript_17964/m.29140 type:complete len:977 (+) Transcript_17964:168-3098(+)
MPRTSEQLKALHGLLEGVVLNKDYQVGLNVYLKCFYGSDLVQVLNAHDLVASNEDPVSLCGELLVDGKLLSVDGNPANNGFHMDKLYRLASEASIFSRRASNAKKGVELFLNSMSDVGNITEAGDLESNTRVITPWTSAQDQALVVAVSKFGENWMLVAHNVPERNELECESRWMEKIQSAKVSNPKHRGSFLSFPRRLVGATSRQTSEEMHMEKRENLTMSYLKRQEEQQNSLHNLQEETSSSQAHRRRANSTDGMGSGAVDIDELKMRFGPAVSETRNNRSSLPPWVRQSTDLPRNLRDRGDTVEAVSSSADSKEVGHNLLLIVIGLANPPDSSRGLRESHYFIKISYGKYSVSTRPVVKRARHGITWGEIMSLDDVNRDTLLEVRLMIKHRLVLDEEVGRTSITVGNLALRPYRQLCLHDSSARTITDSDQNDVTLLKLGVDKSTIPAAWPMPVKAPILSLKYEKHLMIITRGTRGDVQPFLALARALAERYNWLITICTELRYRDYVKENSTNLARGGIQFRISGGDTQKKVDSRISKWAINLQSGAMQHLMLAMSEREFFDSEPPLYYWAKTMKPDYLMFGFTLASVAMIISEALKLPLIGFVLQPTCIPSKQYPPVVPLDENAYKKMLSMAEKKDKKHSDFSSIKVFVENNPVSGHLNHMRAKRGLAPIKRFTGKSIMHAFQSNTWTDLQQKGIPLIAPINDLAFGGKPDDWADTSVLTNYIFLRGGTVPPLSTEHVRFIKNAKQRGDKLLVLAFSSMPVEKLDILRIANKIISKCEKRVCVMAMIGSHTDDPGHDAEIESLAEKYKEEGRLIVSKGAPFGRLFPLMDCIVTHGGLGSTGEALMSQVPVIVTGVLLFDQRYWGSRVHDLGIGPFPVHVSKFMKMCVKFVDKAMSDDGEWLGNAKRVGKAIEDSMENDPSGVDLNARVTRDLLMSAPYFTYERSKRRGTLSLFGYKSYDSAELEQSAEEDK